MGKSLFVFKLLYCIMFLVGMIDIVVRWVGVNWDKLNILLWIVIKVLLGFNV